MERLMPDWFYRGQERPTDPHAAKVDRRLTGGQALAWLCLIPLWLLLTLFVPIVGLAALVLFLIIKVTR